MQITINGGLVSQPKKTTVNPSFVHSDNWFDAELILSNERVLSSTSTQNLTLKDSNIIRSTGAITGRDWLLDTKIYARKTTPNLTCTITNGGKLIQDSSNPKIFKSIVMGGTETITVSSQNRMLTLPVSSVVYSAISTIDTFISFASTSLAKNASDNIDSRLVGKARNDVTNQIYNSQNPDKQAGNYTRNPNLWLNDLVSQLSCIIPWNTNGGYLYGAIPITKRHLIFPAHVFFANNTIFDFVNTDNTLVRCTQIQRKMSPSYTGTPSNGFDFAVGLLDFDLPDWVFIPKLLPSNWRNYLPNIQYAIPVINTHQYEIIAVRDWVSVSSAGYAQFSAPTNFKRSEFYETVRSGDSGNPIFTIVNNQLGNSQLILLSAWTFGGSGSGMMYADFIPQINQLILDVDALAGISTGYQISTVDLSGFPSY